MVSETELSRGEHRAFELIADSKDGLYQCELWKALNTDSRNGSKLAQSLAANGLIDRQEATHDGQRTYLLTSREESSEDETDEQTSS